MEIHSGREEEEEGPKGRAGSELVRDLAPSCHSWINSKVALFTMVAITWQIRHHSSKSTSYTLRIARYRHMGLRQVLCKAQEVQACTLWLCAGYQPLRTGSTPSRAMVAQASTNTVDWITTSAKSQPTHSTIPLIYYHEVVEVQD